MCRRGVHRISLDLFCSWCLVFVFLSGSFAKRIDIPISLCLSTVFCCLVLRETHYKILNDSDHKNANNLSSKFGACVCVSVSVSLCVCVRFCDNIDWSINRFPHNTWETFECLGLFSCPLSLLAYVQSWLNNNKRDIRCVCVCVCECKRARLRMKWIFPLNWIAKCRNQASTNNNNTEMENNELNRHNIL